MMKNRFVFGFFVLLIVLAVGCQNEETGSDGETAQVIEGPYLGMKPPGDVPELFAPGIVADIYREHSGAVFSPDGNELFWSVDRIGTALYPRVVLHMKQENGVWTEPELAPFIRSMGTHINSISPDGRRMYISSLQPAQAGFDTSRRGNTWIVEKTGSGWGEPYMSRHLCNPETRGSDVQEAKSGNLYFYCSVDSDPDWRALVRSRLVDGEYLPFESLGPNVNSEYLDHSITVDADEEYVIFASQRPGGYTEQDLYISFHQTDDTWGPAINLGKKINTTGDSRGWPHLSVDGKYLFFTCSTDPYVDFDIKQHTWRSLREIAGSVMNGLSNIYWVDTSFVEKLRPESGE